MDKKKQLLSAELKKISIRGSQITELAIAVGIDPSSVRRYLKGDVANIPTAEKILEKVSVFS